MRLFAPHVFEQQLQRQAAVERCSFTSRRPRLHVSMAVVPSAAMSSGNHPPCGIFTRLAPQNPSSTVRKVTSNATTAPSAHFQRRQAKSPKSSVVNTISVVTATPYADARLLADLKPSTSAMHAAMSAQLTAGM